MAYGHTLPETGPDTRQVIAENRRMPAIDFHRKREPLEVVLEKKMGVLGGQLNGIPKKRVVLYRPDQGDLV